MCRNSRVDGEDVILHHRKRGLLQLWHHRKRREESNVRNARQQNNCLAAGLSTQEINHELVRRGNNVATEWLAADDGSMSFDSDELLSSVLNFLQRCEDETFGEVMASTGGDLATPSLWIQLLYKTSRIKEPSYILQIANNIGPMVRCMCNDTRRLFFKSNKHWGESIVPLWNSFQI